jgi:hypothetical protein
MSEHSLVATAGVAAAEAVDDIKAVTHNELSLRQRHDGWEATVVFDPDGKVMRTISLAGCLSHLLRINVFPDDSGRTLERALDIR